MPGCMHLSDASPLEACLTLARRWRTFWVAGATQLGERGSDVPTSQQGACINCSGTSAAQLAMGRAYFVCTSHCVIMWADL